MAAITAAAPAAGLRAAPDEIAVFGQAFFRSLWRMGLIFFKLVES